MLCIERLWASIRNYPFENYSKKMKMLLEKGIFIENLFICGIRKLYEGIFREQIELSAKRISCLLSIR